VSERVAVIVADIEFGAHQEFIGCSQARSGRKSANVVASDRPADAKPRQSSYFLVARKASIYLPRRVASGKTV